jgi:hypothetical protein
MANHFSLFGGGYGLNGNLGVTAIGDHPNLFDLGASYGLIGFGGSMQGRELRSVSGTLGLWSGTRTISDVNWTCFEKDAPIETKEGSKFIQDIKVADWVKTWNENTKQFEYKKVLRTFERINEQVLHIRLSNGKLVKVTLEHPFWSNNTWAAAKDLKVGSKLLGSNGKEVFVESVQLIDKATKVYNFEVEDNHTYVAYGVVVHNKCPSALDGFNYYKSGTDKNAINKDGDQEGLICNLEECSKRLKLEQVSQNKNDVLFNFKNLSENKI